MGGSLRHVDNKLGLRLPRGLGKFGGRFHEARPHGVDEVGARHALERAPDGAEVENVADEDLCAEALELVGAFIVLVDEGADGEAPLQKKLRSDASGGTCSATD